MRAGLQSRWRTALRRVPLHAAALLALNAATPLAEEAASGRAQALAFDSERGNCLACHAIAGGRPAGNVGPALQGLAARFPSPAALYAFLWDARETRPWTMMPRYGRNGLLSAQELALITEWLWTL